MDLFYDWQVGEPAKINNRGREVYVRFYKNDEASASLGKLYAMLYFLTPGGTMIRTGRNYVSPLGITENEILLDYERKTLASENDISFYANLLQNIDGKWALADICKSQSLESSYDISLNEIDIFLKRKVVPISRFFKDYSYCDTFNEGILSDIIHDVNTNFSNIEVLNSSIGDDIHIQINRIQGVDGMEEASILQDFMISIQKKLRDFYYNHEVHITRMFGSYILLEKQNGVLKAILATPIPIQYCPLMMKLLKEVGGEAANSLLDSLQVEDTQVQTKNMCRLIDEVVIKNGYFDTNRSLNSCEVNVLFGASETISSGFKDGILDAAVIVSNNLGTIITTNDSNTQGAVKRMTGLFYTSPSQDITDSASEAGIVPVFPFTATIDQLEGVKKAIQMGYKSIAVSVAADENYLHEQFKLLEEQYGVTIYKFGLCSTGIDFETADIMSKNADIIWSCASKYVKELVEPSAIAQVGIKIPVHIMTKQGWVLVKNHLQNMYPDYAVEEVQLSVGDDKAVFLNERGKVKKLLRKDIRQCNDCPHPCI